MALAETAERSMATYDDFDRLVAPVLPSAWQLAASMVQDRTEADDVVQEACVRAWTRLSTLRDVDAFRPWFLSIVANQGRSSLRRQRRHAIASRLLHILARGEGARSMDDGLLISNALARLPLHHRQVVVLHYYFGNTVEQIADVLGVPAGTVMSRLHRAVRAMRTHVGEDETP